MASLSRGSSSILGPLGPVLYTPFQAYVIPSSAVFGTKIGFLGFVPASWGALPASSPMATCRFRRAHASCSFPRTDIASRPSPVRS